MRALLLGGTGAIGGYLQRELVALGWEVVVTSRSPRAPGAGVSFACGNAKNMSFLTEVLATGYDAVVDFMTWTVAEFEIVSSLFLEHTDQYVFLSSYRVFAPSDVVTEESPRLLDSCSDSRYRAGGEYGIKKAREENVLIGSRRFNWTIVRPSITFSGKGAGRFQLGTYELDLWLWRALRGLPVPLVPEMMEKQCTLTWAGDTARLISSLMGNEKARGESYNIATSQHQPWSAVLEAYRTVLPVDVRWVDVGLYESHCGKRALREYGYIPQLRYDRMVDRVLDVSKVLAATGLDSSVFSDVPTRLASELRDFLGNSPSFASSPAIQGRLDRICGISLECGSGFQGGGAQGKMKYLAARMGLG